MNPELLNVSAGESLAYRVPDTGRGAWAFAGHYFSAYENGYLIARESFACGDVRHTKHNPDGFAVIRGTEVIPLRPKPVFSNCNVCGRSLHGDNEFAMGMCTLCSNEVESE